MRQILTLLKVGRFEGGLRLGEPWPASIDDAFSFAEAFVTEVPAAEIDIVVRNDGNAAKDVVVETVRGAAVLERQEQYTFVGKIARETKGNTAFVQYGANNWHCNIETLLQGGYSRTQVVAIMTSDVPAKAAAWETCRTGTLTYYTVIHFLKAEKLGQTS